MIKFCANPDCGRPFKAKRKQKYCDATCYKYYVKILDKIVELGPQRDSVLGKDRFELGFNPDIKRIQSVLPFVARYGDSISFYGERPTCKLPWNVDIIGSKERDVDDELLQKWTIYRTKIDEFP